MKYIQIIGLFAAGFVVGINIESIPHNQEYVPSPTKLLAALSFGVLFAANLVYEFRKP